MSDFALQDILYYPIKSAAGLSVEQAELDRFGVSGDRRWMLVDEQGQFLSQRKLPTLALLIPQPTSLGLSLRWRDRRTEVAIPKLSAARRQVQVWGDTVTALDAGDEVAHWLSAALACACRLVYMPEAERRYVDRAYARQDETVSFADGFPLLLISQGSLDALNERLETPVPMNRFRPNLVVAGCAPFAEDSWQRLRIGDIEMSVVKPCSRCVIPSIDQGSAQRDPSINRALAAFRRFEGQIIFGQNLLQHGTGSLQRGAEVEILA